MNNCDNCLLKGKRVVKSSGSENPEMVFVGDFPNKTEEAVGVGFKGPVGKKFDSLLFRAGIIRKEVGLKNCIDCRPSDNNIDSKEGRSALVCCKSRLEKELIGAKVIILLGGTAISQILGQNQVSLFPELISNKIEISDYRLKQNYWNGIPVIVTYHPAEFLHELSLLKEDETVYDFMRAKNIADGNDEKGEYFILDNFFDVMGVLRGLKGSPKLIFDIETIGLKFGDIILGIGFSKKEKQVFYIPLVRWEFGKIIGSYFNKKETKEIKQGIKQLLENKNIPKGGHNVYFDVSRLKYFGIDTKNIVMDTQIAHYIVESDVHHGHKLGTISQRYPDLIGFKDETQSLIKAGKILHIPMKSLAERCCMDCDSTFRLGAEFGKKLKEDKGCKNLYTKFSLPGARVLSDMERRGILV